MNDGNVNQDLMRHKLTSLLRQQWVSPVEALQKAGCMSLSQRCGDFRREGMNVISEWAEANGKRFKRYRIV